MNKLENAFCFVLFFESLIQSVFENPNAKRIYLHFMFFFYFVFFCFFDFCFGYMFEFIIIIDKS